MYYKKYSFEISVPSELAYLDIFTFQPVLVNEVTDWLVEEIVDWGTEFHSPTPINYKNVGGPIDGYILRFKNADDRTQFALRWL